jgi:hypothetical protein
MIKRSSDDTKSLCRARKLRLHRSSGRSNLAVFKQSRSSTRRTPKIMDTRIMNRKFNLIIRMTRWSTI